MRQGGRLSTVWARVSTNQVFFFAISPVKGCDQQQQHTRTHTHLGERMNGRPENYHTGLLLMTSSLPGIWPLHPFHVLESHSACFSGVTPVAEFEVNLVDSSHDYNTLLVKCGRSWPVFDLPSEHFIYLSMRGLNICMILQLNTLVKHT